MKNLSSGSRTVPCRQTDRWTDTTKLIVAFHNFEMHLPKNDHEVCVTLPVTMCILTQLDSDLALASRFSQCYMMMVWCPVF